MTINTERLGEAIRNIENLIDSGCVSDEMIATAWILAFPPSVARELVTLIDEWVHRTIIAKAEGRDQKEPDNG